MTIATNTVPSTSATTSPDTGSRWEIDPAHSSAQFKARHLMVSHVRGELGPVSGEVFIDERDPGASRAIANIDARGLDSKFAKRDEHLRSADFLDVEHHPFVSFRSTRVVPDADGGLKVTGDLTIRGVTRPVTLDVDPLPSAVNDPWGNTKRGATARTHFDRKEWGLVWNLGLETGGVLVGDRIDVEIELELVRS